MTIVGTRPEIIRLACVMQELDRYVNQVIVHTGQNYDYELNEIFFNEMGIRKPDYFMQLVFSLVDATITRHKGSDFLLSFLNALWKIPSDVGDVRLREIWKYL